MANIRHLSGHLDQTVNYAFFKAVSNQYNLNVPQVLLSLHNHYIHSMYLGLNKHNYACHFSNASHNIDSQS